MRMTEPYQANMALRRHALSVRCKEALLKEDPYFSLLPIYWPILVQGLLLGVGRGHRRVVLQAQKPVSSY